MRKLKTTLEKHEKPEEIAKRWRMFNKKLREIDFSETTQSEKEELCMEMRDLTFKIIDNKETAIARKSVRSEYHLIKLCYVTASERLEKLQCLGVSMQRIAEEEEPRVQFTAEYELMDDILDEMHAISVGKVHIEFKCELITCFCISYGFCCIEKRHYTKAIEILQQAIFMMKFALGKECNQNQFCTSCYQNLGVAYQKIGKKEASNKAFEKAKGDKGVVNKGLSKITLGKGLKIQVKLNDKIIKEGFLVSKSKS